MRGALSKEIENGSKNKLGLGFELDNPVCGRKKECVGAGISGGGPPWAHEAGGAPSTLVGTW